MGEFVSERKKKENCNIREAENKIVGSAERREHSEGSGCARMASE